MATVVDPEIQDDDAELGNQQFRESLANELQSIPKHTRKKILESVKNTPDYWQSRTKHSKERQEEPEIDNGLGILVKMKTIYHGSGIEGIKEFDVAEETTVGNGIYCTSEAKDAIGYARRRAKSEKTGVPVIYEASIEDLKLLDLRNDENVQKILPGYASFLQKHLKRSDLQWHSEKVILRSIKAITSGKVRSGNLKTATFNTGALFSEYVRSLAYDGLIALEGGEGNDVGRHDTYLIFDPSKVKIVQQHKIE